MIYAFRYIIQQKLNPLSIAIILACFGYISFYIPINSTEGHNNDGYAMGFLQPLLSMMALVALSYPIGRLVNGDKNVIYHESISFFNILRTLSIVFSAILVMFSILVFLLDLQYRKLYLFSLVITMSSIFLCSAAIALYRQYKWFRSLIHLSFGLLLVLGLVSSYPTFVIYGLGRSYETIYLSSDEYRGLKALRNISNPSDLIATNKHDIPERPDPGRSYQYLPIIERRILLEGFGYREADEFIFDTIKRDNDLLFSTSDTTIVKRIVDKYGIDFIVCRPETVLQMPTPLPAWLKVLNNTGSLTVYEVLR